jgi:tetratricopeptide (TPR) repeat protein
MRPIAAILALASACAQDVDRLMARARDALAAGEPEKAAEAFGRACELEPRHREACYFHGRALQALDRFQDALAPLERALASNSDSRIHRALALNYIALTQAERAESHFLSAIRQYKGGEDPRIDYGAFLTRQARAAEAIPVLEAAVKADNKSARAYTELGRAQLEAGKAEAAAKSLERALDLDAGAWAVRLLLGRAYQQLGRTADAERQLELGRKGWAARNSRAP